MPRFFIQPGNILETGIVITGDDYFHMSRTLRMRPGEAVTVCDPQGMEYHCRIRRMEADRAELEVESSCPGQSEPSLEVCLFQCVPKGDKMDTIVQKAVELGVAHIVPVLSRNCVVRLDTRAGEKKAQRWDRIALEAAKQCGRSRVPHVEAPISFAQALQRMKTFERGILLYEEERQCALAQMLTPGLRQLAFLVGSEGGLAPEEARLAREQGIPTVSLGARILRTETVAPAVLAIAMYVTENL